MKEQKALAALKAYLNDSRAGDHSAVLALFAVCLTRLRAVPLLCVSFGVCLCALDGNAAPLVSKAQICK